MNNKEYFVSEDKKNRSEWKSASGSGDETPKEPMKMLYVAHDLKNNYHNATGDAKMKRDIIMSEIAKLIVNRPDEVVALLEKYDLKVPKKPTHKHLVKAVSHGLHKSKKFAADIAILIVGKKELSADGDKTTDYSSLLGSASDLVNGLGNLFGGKKKAKAQKAANEAERKKLEAQAALEKAKGEAALNGASKGMGGDMSSNIGWYIAGGVAVAAVIGFSIYWFKFRKK